MNSLKHISAQTFVGVNLAQIISIRIEEETVTRYDEMTGEAYQKAIPKTKYFLVDKDVTDKITSDFDCECDNIVGYLEELGFESFSMINLTPDKDEINHFFIGLEFGYEPIESNRPGVKVGNLGDHTHMRDTFQEAQELFSLIGYNEPLQAITLLSYQR